MTIHSLIYRTVPLSDGGVRFELRRPQELDVKLIIVDECSMINKELGSDLASFGRPILALGDPFQLPPIEGDQFFLSRPPDFKLTEIHRQAMTSPVLKAATDLRRGIFPASAYDGDLQVMALSDATIDMFIHADQIVVGKNVTRRRVNRLVRMLRGFDPAYPEEGDRLVCIKSNRKRGLVNGSLWRVKLLRGEDAGLIKLEVVAEENPGRSRTIRVHRDFFLKGAEAVSVNDRRHSDQFDYAYALTAHKAQGSQWRSVLVINECDIWREEPQRWLYTAITRASKKAVVLNPGGRARRDMPSAIRGAGRKTDVELDVAFEKAFATAYLRDYLSDQPLAAFETMARDSMRIFMREMGATNEEATKRGRRVLDTMFRRGAIVDICKPTQSLKGDKFLDPLRVEIAEAFELDRENAGDGDEPSGAESRSSCPDVGGTRPVNTPMINPFRR